MDVALVIASLIGIVICLSVGRLENRVKKLEWELSYLRGKVKDLESRG